MTPQEIEGAIKSGMTTAHVSEDGKHMTLVLRPASSSRVFQVVTTIDEVEEL